MIEDTIKRSDAIKAICENCEYYKNEKVINDIKALPSADRPSNPHDITYINALKNRIKELERDRPQGEWIDDEFLGQYRCSECDYYSVDEFDYCPNCGARMFAKDTNVPNKKGADDESVDVL